MVGNVVVSDSRCSCSGEIIASDLKLVASRIFAMAVTCPLGHVPLFQLLMNDKYLSKVIDDKKSGFM